MTSQPTTEENMLTLIQYIQLPEQERLAMMKGNVVQSNEPAKPSADGWQENSGAGDGR